MAYNENDLNPTKGTIGEYIYANFLDYSSKGQSRCIDPDLQRYGIDWRIEGPTHRIDIDVKLSDHLGDYFAVTYRNSNNIRMPFKKGCEATWLGIITFDWSKFIEEESPTHYKEGLSSTENELQFAHFVRDTLMAEYASQTKYTWTKKLIKKYTVSIVDIKVQTVQQLCRGFAEKEDGDGNYESGEVVALRQGSDHYAAAHIKWGAIKPQSKTVHYENKVTGHEEATKPFALTVKWPFYQNRAIAINEREKTLEEMSQDSLNWIKDQNQSPKSTFRKRFHLDQSQFDRLLSTLIIDKKKIKK